MRRLPSLIALAAAPVFFTIGTSASAGQLFFTETIVDEQPLAANRINDIAVGDIDGDGRPDIWVSGRNGSGHQAAWYKNPGDQVTPWKRYVFAKGSWKYGDLGDVDGDGDVDIAAGYNTDKKVYWVENTGSPEGAPWPKHYLGIKGAPDQVFVRDLNGDKRNEIIVLNKNGPIWILRRPDNPRNPWLKTKISKIPRGTAGGTVGDVDNDGDPDIVFGNRWYENPQPDGDWHRGDAWTARTIDDDWTAEARSCVVDIDRDGRNDIVLTGEENKDGVAWYRKKDPRSAGPWTRVRINRTPYQKLHSCHAADFDGDGRFDVMVAEMHTSRRRRITIFLQGDDVTKWNELVVATVGAHNARAADLDGDGVLDLITKNFEGDMRPRVWFGGKAAKKLPLDRWRRHVIARRLPHRATFIRAGDLNGDRLPDIIAGGWWWANPGTAEAPWKRHSVGGRYKNMAVVHDFDGDGDLDLLGTDGDVSGSNFYLASNSGRGDFIVTSVGPAADGDFLQGAAVGSFLGTGTQVVLSWHNGARTKPVKGTQWYRVPTDPKTPWRWERIHAFSNEEEISLGDVDGDGGLDIHLGSHWLQNDGEGAFKLMPAVRLPKGSVDRVRLADIDGDGDLDVVIGAERAKHLLWGENPGPGDNGLWKHHTIASAFLHMSLDVADIDGDGDLDVVSGAHKGDGKVAIYENSHQGKRWRSHTVDPGIRTVDHHAGTQLVDIDGDGDLDIVSVGWKKTSVTLYENLAISKQD
ncbi:MAG: VCBS repeat-containing protein [Alphaproteobacteria bacterium]|nr:VCBS repeat-containing protein [Alphaproteobacteria bacterium]